MNTLTDLAFRHLLDALVCNDPAPNDEVEQQLAAIVNHEAVVRGFRDWIDAYHEFKPQEGGA